MNKIEELELEAIEQEAKELKNEFSELKEVFIEFLNAGFLGDITPINNPSQVVGERVKDSAQELGEAK
jgi:hypothetical protein|tara:strand:+ start:148 stop:351 length:204 start_codon:yes stop_codon:yes gene_type:complete